MIRFSTVRGTALALVLGAGTIAANCSKTGRNTAPAGTVSLAFEVPSGASIGEVVYVIHAGAPTGIPDVTGHIDTSGPNATASVQHVFPASTGDTVTLDATTSAGVSCHGGSLPFDVASGGTARVDVTLVCGAPTNPPSPGTVIVNSMVVDGNACPYLTSWVASPLQVAVGSTIDVGAAATDLSTPPDTLSFAWTPAANFAAPTAATTKYVCTAAGTHTITVTVSDNHGSSPCKAAVSIDVTCHVIVECGDGLVELPEHCDPPNGTTCDSTCQLISGGTGGSPTQCSSTGSGGSSGIGPQALACASCEANATADGTCFNTSVDGVTNGCDGFTNCDQRAACYALLSCIRTGGGSGQTCANFDDPTPCLCGSLTPDACVRSDPSTLLGVCRPQYIAANDGAGANLFSVFFGVASPVGIANNLFTCDIDMAADASLSCPSTVCGVQQAATGGTGGSAGAPPTGGSTGSGGAGGDSAMGGSRGAAGAAGASATGGVGGAGGMAGNRGTGGEPLNCTGCELAALNDGTCFNTSVDGITNGCDGFTGPDRDACLALLTCVRTGNGSGHTCAVFDDPTRCLCGDLGPSACAQSDPTTLSGVCRPQYIAANGGTGTGLFGAFFSTMSPVGIANNLFTCDIDMADDSTLSCPSSVCGVQ